MKILMLTWEYPPRIVGGIARVVHDLSKRLIKDGHEVHVITYREEELPAYENDKGVHVHRVDNYIINPNSFVDWIMQLNFNMVAKANALIVKEGNFDVIHAHDWLVAYSAKTLKQSWGTPLVSTIHATEAGRNSGIHNEVQRYVNDTEWLLTYESSEVIVNSKYMKNELQRLFGLPYEKINVVSNGINMTAYNGVERDYEFRRQYAADNEKIILFMGRLVFEKGVQHLISAMPKILESYNDAKLVIAGKGGMTDSLIAQAESMGIKDKVYFTGYLDAKKVSKLYKCSDVSVFPSTYEPFGIVALEAMLAGVPTVVSDIGGLDEIVDHGIDGLKSYAGNPNSIADSITALLFNPELCQNIAKKAKQKVKNEYNWAKIAQDTHFTYQKAICQTMAERQANQIAQEKARKKKAKESTVTNLLDFKQRQAYA
ncbi:MAG: glycosyltransferase family 4 protein [Oscillospiraceae bacterium]|nr:glycosyltransferase family 4 protein [Oscillospiraceae bacterium]